MEKEESNIVKYLHYELVEPLEPLECKNYLVLIHGLKSSWVTFKVLLQQLQELFPSLHILVYD